MYLLYPPDVFSKPASLTDVYPIRAMDPAEPPSREHMGWFTSVLPDYLAEAPRGSASAPVAQPRRHHYEVEVIQVQTASGLSRHLLACA